jgi:hypothetical protein
MHTKLLSENPKGKDHVQDLDVDGKIILYLREIGWDGVDWIHLRTGTIDVLL